MLGMACILIQEVGSALLGDSLAKVREQGVSDMESRLNTPCPVGGEQTLDQQQSLLKCP